MKEETSSPSKARYESCSESHDEDEYGDNKNSSCHGSYSSNMRSNGHFVRNGSRQDVFTSWASKVPSTCTNGSLKLGWEDTDSSVKTVVITQ